VRRNGILQANNTLVHTLVHDQTRTSCAMRSTTPSRT